MRLLGSTRNDMEPKIAVATEALKSIQWKILARTPDFLTGMYRHLVERRASMNDQLQANTLIEQGKRCDLFVLDAADHRQLLYQFGSARTHMVIAGGRIVA